MHDIYFYYLLKIISKQEEFRGPNGPQGTAGYNGTTGKKGDKGVGINFAGCYSKNNTEYRDVNTVTDQRTVSIDFSTTMVAVGAYCESLTALNKTISTTDRGKYYQCSCQGVKSVADVKKMDCTLHIFLCPKHVVSRP